MKLSHVSNVDNTVAARAASSLALSFVSYQHLLAYPDHLAFFYLSDFIEPSRTSRKFAIILWRILFSLPPIACHRQEHRTEIRWRSQPLQELLVTLFAFLKEYLSNDLLETSKTYSKMPSKEKRKSLAGS